MTVNSDWTALLHVLNAAGVRYMVVGAHAAMLYSRARATIDFDVWVARDADNAKRVWEALARFGAPMDGTATSEFESDDLIFQIGVAPGRVDIITSIDGVAFEDAWPRRVAGTYGDATATFIGRADLLRNKRATRRAKDAVDVERIERDSG